MHFLNKLVVLVIFLSGLSNVAFAFELASENTLSDVNIPAATSAQALMSAADYQLEYQEGGYEVMPFKTSITVAVEDTDEVSLEADFASVQEVGSQLESETQKSDSNILLEAISRYLPPSLAEVIGLDSEEVTEATVIGDPSSQSAAATVFGQLEQTFNIISASVESMTYNVTRYLEQASAFNITPNPEQATLGSTHISNMQSESIVTISEHK
jgi:spore maturation protein SpmB